MKKDDGSGWNSFEPYKGPDDELKVPAWLGQVLHWTMIVVILAVVFVVVGFGMLLFLYNPRFGLSRVAAGEAQATPWIIFIVSGLIADGLLVSWSVWKR